MLFAFASSMLITWDAIPRIIRVVNSRKLKDKPGKHKIHKQEIPTLGGIGIFAAFSFGFLFAVTGHMPEVTYFMAALLILFFIGVKDDLIYLNPKKKLLVEIVAALIIVLFIDLHFTSIHGIFRLYAISAWVSYIITVFLIVLIINAYNLIDGIDGLAASVGIIASATFGFWFWLSDDYGYAIMAAALLGSLLVFMGYNLSSGPNKIFMGDTGSLIVGFILAVFAVRFNELNASSTANYQLVSSPAISIAILIVPLFDMLRIITLRLYHRLPLFEADNRHLHHLFLRAGLSHRRSTAYIASLNIALISLAFLLDGLGIVILCFILLGICLAVTKILLIAVKKRESVLSDNGLIVDEEGHKA